MFVLNGLPPRLMVVNIKTGEVEVKHELPDDAAARSKECSSRNSAACATPRREPISFPILGTNTVVEYDKNFNEIWSYHDPARRGPPFA